MTKRKTNKIDISQEISLEKGDVNKLSFIKHLDCLDHFGVTILYQKLLYQKILHKQRLSLKH